MVAEIEPGMVDALGFHETQAEIAEVIVVRRGNRKFQVRHSFPLVEREFQSLNMCS